MSWLFGGGTQKTATEVQEDEANYRAECVAAMETMLELCQDLLDPSKVLHVCEVHLNMKEHPV
jgi:hypothetical protein